MRLLVCGGRDFSDTAHACRVLDRLHRAHGVDVVIEGNARGADRIAGYWARSRGIHNLKFPADWNRDGRAAGPIRNARMLADGKPDFVLAFPGGVGTADMVRRARAAGVPIQHEILRRGSDRNGENSRSEVEGEASQSGAESASPAPHNPEHPHG